VTCATNPTENKGSADPSQTGKRKPKEKRFIRAYRVTEGVNLRRASLLHREGLISRKKKAKEERKQKRKSVGTIVERDSGEVDWARAGDVY